MTLRSSSFVVPVPDVALNLNDRLPPRAHSARKATWRDAAFWWAKQHRLMTRGAIAPVDVWFEFGVKDPGRRRDPHNWYPTVKAVLDGFTHAAVWEDDDSTHVHTLEPVFTDKVPAGHLRINLAWEVPDDAT